MFQTKRFTGLSELVQLYKQNPSEKFLIFTIYQNYTLALMYLQIHISNYTFCLQKITLSIGVSITKEIMVL